jgi:hypothetical protein
MPARITISKEEAAEIAVAVAYWFRQHHGSTLEITTVAVEPYIEDDEYENECLDIIVIFDADESKLETQRRTGIFDKLRRKLGEMRLYAFPHFSYMSKRQCEKRYHGIHLRSKHYYRGW